MKWEYLVSYSEDDGQGLIDELDKLGGNGWELVSVSLIPSKEKHGVEYKTFFFKRPKDT